MRAYSVRSRFVSLGATACLLLAASAASQAQNPTIVAGTPPGQFGVSSGGSASYTIPISVPPGVAGMQPNLALSYNSQGGGGLLGMGWSLGGLSAITRCPRTMAQDGVRGSVSFDDNDRYCLDGQRLMLSSGSYGQANAEYRTEMESFSKIVSYSRAGNGAASFKVWTKGGQIMEYGNTADSRIEAVAIVGTTPVWPAATARVWALNKVTDAKGNYLTVSYDEDSANGVYRPARIDYAGNLVAATPTHSSVRFSYQERANPVAKYQAGAITKLTSTLTEVTVYHGDASVVSKTMLGYQNVGPTQTPRLSTVQQCDGALQCLSPLNLTYAADVPGFSATWATWNGPPRQESADGNISLVDLNGDGLPDVFTTGGNPGLVAYNNVQINGGYAFNYPVVMGNPAYQRVVDTSGDWQTAPGGVIVSLIDLNGDGLPDLYITSGAGAGTVRLNVGGGFANSAPAWPNSPVRHRAYDKSRGLMVSLVDLNGDGLPDLYTTAGDAGTGTLRFNTGSGFSDTATSWPNSPARHELSDDAGGLKVSLVDLNGDGLPDLYTTSGNAGEGTVRFNTGSGFSDTVTPWPNSPARQRVSTWNGDVLVSLVDLNGDGLPDLYMTTGNEDQGTVRFNTGSGFSGTDTPWPNSPARIRINDTVFGGVLYSLTDVIGDGVPAVFYCGGDPRNGSGGCSLRLGAGAPPHLLVQVSSATGPTTTITYARLREVYTKDSGANAAVFPAVDMMRAPRVVASVSSSNGIGGVNTTTYTYGGLKSEVGTGRGMLGFRWVKSKDTSTGLERYTEYRQDFPYTGMASKSETRLNYQPDTDAGVLKRVINTFGCHNPQTGAACTPAPGKSYFPYTASQSEEDFNSYWVLAGYAGFASIVTLTTNTQYTVFPHYGGPSQTSLSSTEGWSKTTVNEYLAPDTSNWIVGRLKKSSVTSVKP
ncbi:FG-GAP-like repeat-containing protein [Rhodoferax sp.]|uniref:FG-GAP-like repeat-containing protein n=1 Tax=Rhodoferax sp. TaxID=50421 RepID=UPI00275F99EE|nr:FG-GAP-like repeat-containing protein [Rhodoferax sp.]